MRNARCAVPWRKKLVDDGHINDLSRKYIVVHWNMSSPFRSEYTSHFFAFSAIRIGCVCESGIKGRCVCRCTNAHCTSVPFLSIGIYRNFPYGRRGSSIARRHFYFYWLGASCIIRYRHRRIVWHRFWCRFRLVDGRIWRRVEEKGNYDWLRQRRRCSTLFSISFHLHLQLFAAFSVRTNIGMQRTL